MSDETQEKIKNDDANTNQPVNINITNTPNSSGGLINIGFIVAALLIGLVLSQFIDLSPYFSWWGRPAYIEVPDDVFIPEVEHLRSLAELTTTQYNYAEVVTGQRNMPGWLSSLYGDSAIMVIVGTIEAGIDISLLSEADIVHNEETQTLSITLPAPELQNCFLDETKSYVVSRDTAIFADTMDNLEDSLRQNALHHYRDLALEEGILVDAANAADTALRGLLNILVDDAEITIQIDFSEPPVDSVLPDNCQ